MLDYEWVNPSTIILAGNETTAAATDSDQHNYAAMLPDPILHGSTTQNNGFSHHNHFNFNPSPQPNNNHQHHPFFHTRAFQSASSATFSPPPSMLPLGPLTTSHSGLGLGLGPGLGFLHMPKSENIAMNVESSAHGICHGPGPGLGLNLGGRTYFPSCNDDTVNRFHHRPVESAPAVLSNSPRCQAEGCNADLSNAKHYHRRHKVCEYHSKAATVIAAGLTQRFCQQCSRFHLLSEFDNGKRSCRKRLADHNRRRRKNQQQQAQEIHKPQPSLDNVSRSSPECGAQSWSSTLKMKVSPPDYFLQEKPNGNNNRGSSSSSLFFSTG